MNKPESKPKRLKTSSWKYRAKPGQSRDQPQQMSVRDDQSQVQELQNQVREAQNQVEVARNRAQEAESKVSETQNLARETQSQLEEARKQARDAQNKVSEIQNQTRDSQSQLQAAQNKVLEAQKQAREAQNQVLRNLTNKLGTLRAKSWKFKIRLKKYKTKPRARATPHEGLRSHRQRLPCMAAGISAGIASRQRNVANEPLAKVTSEKAQEPDSDTSQDGADSGGTTQNG